MIASSSVVTCTPPLESSTPPISPMSSSSASSPIEAPNGLGKRDTSDALDLSLPEMEGWCQKEGSYLSFLSDVFVRLAHGVLNVYRSDEFMAPAIQRLVLQGCTITENDENGCIQMKTNHGTCNLIVPDRRQEWYDAIVESRTWNLDTFYEQHHQIAAGASSAVLVAKRRRTGTLFALKSIDKAEAMPTVCEVNILKKAHHEHVMKASDVLESEDEIHIVQQLMDGSLRDVIKASSGGGLPEQYAKSIMHAVLRALKYLHDNDIVHRDIKPDNILLRDTNTNINDGLNTREIRVGDFGLSAFISRLTAGSMCGTPHYASPELVKGEVIDGKSDVWACGVMLFEILTDKMPFQATTYERLWAKIKLAQFDVKCLQYKAASIPARTLVMQMLTPAREKRISVEAALQHEWFHN